jgi:hypothetical protein
MFNSAPPEELARIHLQDGRQGEVIRIPLGQPNLGACQPMKLHISTDRGETAESTRSCENCQQGLRPE